LQESTFSRRVFWMRGWQRALFTIFGLALSGLGVFVVLLAIDDPQNGPPIAVAIIPLGVGLYLAALALRSRLIVDKDHLEVRGVFSEKYAELSDVEGFRTISTRNGSFWRLQLKNGRGNVTIQKWFNCDELQAWLQQIPDLDERDRNALLEEIKQAQDLGATPDERLLALKQASHLNIALTALVIAAAAVFFIYEGSIRLTASAILALTPVLVLYLLHKDPLLYAVGKPKRDPRADLIIAVLVSGMGLMFGGIAVNFVSYKVLFEWGALVAALYVFAFFTFTRKGPRVQGYLIIMLIYGGLYAYGLVTVADTMLDHAPAITFATSVIGEHEVHGKSTTYYLDLAPWGPFDRDNKLSVPHGEYLRAQMGEAICLALHPGYLHAEWYTRVDCGDHFIVGSEQ
jgi:hypothetical protein